MPKGEGAGAEAEPRALAEPTRSPKTAHGADQQSRQHKTETRRSEPSTITVGGFFHGAKLDGERANPSDHLRKVVTRLLHPSVTQKSRSEALIPLTCCFSGAGDGNRTRVISLEVLRLFAPSRLPAKTRSLYLLFLCLLRLKRLCFIVQSTQVVTRLLHGVLHGNEGGTHGTNWGNVQLLFSFSLR